MSSDDEWSPTCSMCIEDGHDTHHTSSMHEMIIAWQAWWGGQAGWRRKQDIANAKRHARDVIALAKRIEREDKRKGLPRW